MDRMRIHLTNMCTGWDVAQVREIVSETLHDIIDPIVYDEAGTPIALPESMLPANGRGIGIWISFLAALGIVGAGVLQAAEEL